MMLVFRRFLLYLGIIVLAAATAIAVTSTENPAAITTATTIQSTSEETTKVDSSTAGTNSSTTAPSTTAKHTTQKPTTQGPTTPKSTTQGPTTPGTTAAPGEKNLTSYTWNVNGTDNKTCFLGHFALRMEVLYLNNKTEWEKTFFDYSSNEVVKNMTNCTGDSMSIHIHSMKLNQNLTVTFNKTDKSHFSLVKAELMLNFDNKTFPNYMNMTGSNTTLLTAVSEKSLKVMRAPLDSYYTCSMESQISLAATKGENVAMYLRVAEVDKLQAFTTEGKYGKPSKCFLDQKHAEPDAIDVKIKDEKNATCARFQSKMIIDLQYKDLSEKTVAVSIPVFNYNLTNSNCSENVTFFNIEFDNKAASPMNLRFQFNRTIAPSNMTFGGLDDYALTSVIMTYKGNNRFLQNHQGYSATHMITNSTLDLHRVPVGNSYECGRSDEQLICNMQQMDNLNLTFTMSHWEFFGMNGSDKFSKSKACAAAPTTPPQTTATATTIPIIPDNPTVESIRVVDSKDNKTVCLFANMGLQLRATYMMTNGKPSEEYINIDLSNNTNMMASCNVNESAISFTHPHYQGMFVNMTFVNATGFNYLRELNVTYNLTKQFPNAKNANKTVTLTNTKLVEMKVPDAYSFSCKNNETDVLLENATDSVIVRFTGLQWQAFGVNGTKFSNVSKCFGDTRPMEANRGDWQVMEGNTTCARYQMKAQAYVSYTSFTREEQVVMIPLDNTTKPNSDSKCGNSTAGELSTLALTMDGGKINFTFSFNASDKDYSLKMTHFSYDWTSKYFPNHEKAEKTDMSNNTLNYFNTTLKQSYKCSKRVVVLFNGTHDRVDISDVQVQPYGITKENNGTFSAAFDCASDSETGWTTRKIVAVVLIVLIGLVIIGGCIYCIYRVIKRKKEKAIYQTIA